MKPTIIEITRHGIKANDPKTGKSLDQLSEEGIHEALKRGEERYHGEKDIIMYHSPLKRTGETVWSYNLGAGGGGVYKGADQRLGLDSLSPVAKKLGLDGEDKAFSRKIMNASPGIDKKVAGEGISFIQDAYNKHKKDTNPHVVAVSHDVKTPMIYGQLVGRTDYDAFRPRELDRLVVKIDNDEHGKPTGAQVNYQERGWEKVDLGKLLGSGAQHLKAHNDNTEQPSVSYAAEKKAA